MGCCFSQGEEHEYDLHKVSRTKRADVESAFTYEDVVKPHKDAPFSAEMVTNGSVQVETSVKSKFAEGPNVHPTRPEESEGFVKCIEESTVDSFVPGKHRHDSSSSFVELEAPAASVEGPMRVGSKEIVSVGGIEREESEVVKVYPASIPIEADTSQKVPVSPVSSSSSSSSSTASTPQSNAPEVEFVDNSSAKVSVNDQDTQFIILNRDETEKANSPSLVSMVQDEDEDEDEVSSHSSSTSSNSDQSTSSEEEESEEESTEKEDNEEESEEEEDSGTESSKEDEFYKIKQALSPKFILLHNDQNTAYGNDCLSPTISKSRVVSIGGSSSSSPPSSSSSSSSSPSSSPAVTPKSHTIEVNEINHQESENYKWNNESSIMTSDVFTSTCETQEDFNLHNTANLSNHKQS